MSFGSSRPDNPTEEAALEEGRLALDLSDGMTREEVGMPAGRSSYSIGHTGGEPPITVTLELADGGTLERQVSDVTFSPDDLTDPDADPTTVDLSQRRLTFAEAQALLEESVADLDLDAEEVRAWVQSVTDAGPGGTYRTRVFDGARRGPMRVAVEVAHFVEQERFGLRTLLTFTA